MHESSYFIELDQLDENPANPRKRLNAAKDLELRDSICSVGIVQALLVRPKPQTNGDPNRFEVIAGNRRLRAARAAGLVQVPCRVVELDDRDALEAALTENAQRDDVHPLDEAEGFKALLDSHVQYDIATVAMKLGKTPRFVAQRISLLNLIPRLRDLLERDLLTLGIAMIVARHSAADQEAFVEEYGLAAEREKVDGKWFLDEPLRVDDVHGFFKALLADLSRASWDLDDAKLLPAAGACSKCPKRTSAAGALFDDVADSCRDAKCFDAKREASLKVALKSATPDVLLVSTQHQAKKAPDGALSASAYAVVQESDAEDRCRDQKGALLVDGPRAGEKVLVCQNRKCKVHGAYVSAMAATAERVSKASPMETEYDRKRKADEAKAKLERERRADLLMALAISVGQDADDDVTLPRLVNLLLEATWKEMWVETRKAVGRVLGFEGTEVEDLRNWIVRAPFNAGRKRSAIVAVICARDLAVHSHEPDAKTQVLDELAKSFGVKVAKPTPAKTAAKTPAKAKAKTKAKKQKTPPPPRGKKAAAAAEAGQ